MDKLKVLRAYQSGLLSIQECAQITGIEASKLIRMWAEYYPNIDRPNRLHDHSVSMASPFKKSI